MSNGKNDMGRIWKAGGKGEGEVFPLHTTNATIAPFVFLPRHCFELNV